MTIFGMLLIKISTITQILNDIKKLTDIKLATLETIDVTMNRIFQKQSMSRQKLYVLQNMAFFVSVLFYGCELLITNKENKIHTSEMI